MPYKPVRTPRASRIAEQSNISHPKSQKTKDPQVVKIKKNNGTGIFKSFPEKLWTMFFPKSDPKNPDEYTSVKRNPIDLEANYRHLVLKPDERRTEPNIQAQLTSESWNSWSWSYSWGSKAQTTESDSNYGGKSSTTQTSQGTEKPTVVNEVRELMPRREFPNEDFFKKLFSPK